jgi:hypothetical protein
MIAAERRLLALLADSRNGASEALLLALGFSRAAIVDLLHAGSVTIAPEQSLAAKRPVHLTRVRITDVGRLGGTADVVPAERAWLGFGSRSSSRHGQVPPADVWTWNYGAHLFFDLRTSPELWRIY